VFSRFFEAGRAGPPLIFARNPVIAIHNGAPTLMVRIANARNNFISDASAKLWGHPQFPLRPEGRRLDRVPTRCASSAATSTIRSSR